MENQSKSAKRRTAEIMSVTPLPCSKLPCAALRCCASRAVCAPRQRVQRHFHWAAGDVSHPPRPAGVGEVQPAAGRRARPRSGSARRAESHQPHRMTHARSALHAADAFIRQRRHSLGGRLPGVTHCQLPMFPVKPVKPPGPRFTSGSVSPLPTVCRRLPAPDGPCPVLSCPCPDSAAHLLSAEPR